MKTWFILITNCALQIHKTIHVHSRSTAERALRFSRAVRRTLISQQGSADLEITETEEYLGFLRAKKALIEIRVTEADEQIGVVREILDQNRLSEVLLSDDGDDGQTFSASSSSGVDTSTEPPSSEDPTGWPAESFISCNLDSPSIRSKRQKVMEGLMEQNGDRWDGPLSDEYDSDYE